jgi:hypothetical protein
MEKTLKYEAVILSFLKDYEPVLPHGWKEVKNEIVIDRENKHYQLIRVGWHENKRIHYVVFHFDIIGDKVWIQQNRTDMPVAEELRELGVSADDIILGYWKTKNMPAA